MFCKYCGKEIDDDAVFCVKCGKDLKTGEKTEGASSNKTLGSVQTSQYKTVLGFLIIINIFLAISFWLNTMSANYAHLYTKEEFKSDAKDYQQVNESEYYIKIKGSNDDHHDISVVDFAIQFFRESKVKSESLKEKNQYELAMFTLAVFAFGAIPVSFFFVLCIYYFVIKGYSMFYSFIRIISLYEFAVYLLFLIVMVSENYEEVLFFKKIKPNLIFFLIIAASVLSFAVAEREYTRMKRAKAQGV